MRIVVLVILIIFIINYIWYRYAHWKLFKKTRITFNSIIQENIIKNEDNTAEFLEKKISKWRKNGQSSYIERYKDIIAMLKNIKKRPLKILDVGCADGYLLNKIIQKINTNKINLYGVDISQNRVNLAQKRLKNNNNVYLSCANAERLPYQNNQFDIIISIETLEHLIDPDKAIQEMKRILKANGLIVMMTPSKHLSFISYFRPIALINPLIWIEITLSICLKSILPPFHNLYRPHDENTVIHRAFTFSDIKCFFKETKNVQITTSDFLFEEFLPPIIAMWYRTIFSKIPLLKNLGRRLIIKINKSNV